MSPLYPDFLPFFMKGKTLMLWTNGKTCDLGILTRFFRTQRSQAVSSGARVPSCLYSERRQKLQIKARLSKKADKLKCQSSTSPEGAFFLSRVQPTSLCGSNRASEQVQGMFWGEGEYQSLCSLHIANFCPALCAPAKLSQNASHAVSCGEWKIKELHRKVRSIQSTLPLREVTKTGNRD